MRYILSFALACVAVGCGWPATRMEPVADYGARSHPTVSGAPAYVAGPSYRRTYSPDGSTAFVCTDGDVISASTVMPGATPAC